MKKRPKKNSAKNIRIKLRCLHENYFLSNKTPQVQILWQQIQVAVKLEARFTRRIVSSVRCRLVYVGNGWKSVFLTNKKLDLSVPKQFQAIRRELFELGGSADQHQIATDRLPDQHPVERVEMCVFC